MLILGNPNVWKFKKASLIPVDVFDVESDSLIYKL